jgi:hypothetical protein
VPAPPASSMTLTAGQPAPVKDTGQRTREVTLDPGALRTLRSETKGQAGACPDRTRAIPCTVRVGLLLDGPRRVDSNGDSNSSDQRQAATTSDSAQRSHDPRQLGICPASLAEGRSTAPSRREPGLRITDPCPRDIPELPSIANDRHRQPPANIKLGLVLNRRATHGDTLVMRRSSAVFRYRFHRRNLVRNPRRLVIHGGRSIPRRGWVPGPGG